MSTIAIVAISFIAGLAAATGYWLMWIWRAAK